jgi:hypothetical protein
MPPDVSGMENRKLVPGTELLGEFSRSLSAKKLKAGDLVKAKLTQDLVVQGMVLAPANSQLVGHVTEARAWTAGVEDSRLGIVFDRILLKHHKELDFHAVLQALAPPVQRVSRSDMPDPMGPPSMGIPQSGRSRRSGASSMNPMGPDPGFGTPGRLGENDRVRQQRNSRSRPANEGSLSAGAGVHGVYGIKNLALSSSPDREAVVVCKNSDVKLSSGTQMLLLVVKR